MWILDAIEWFKNWFATSGKDVILYAAVVIVLLLSGILRKLYNTIKNAILSLLTTEGLVTFIISAAAVLFFLSKIGLIRW
jgi:hypothetical protein